MEREEVRFKSHGDRCAAWLYPSRSGTMSPAIVMAHGLTGTRRDRLGAFAERFAQAGITALVFDHRGFGDSGGTPDLFEPRRQLEDWAAAIDHSRSLDGIDPTRIATFGSSMGGGNALAAAATDPKVAAAVSQVPFLTMMQAYRSPLRVQASTTFGMLAASIAPGWSASARPTGWRRLASRSGLPAGRRSGSCGPIPVSTTSISTTVPSTRPLSPTRSSSYSDTFRSEAGRYGSFLRNIPST